MGSFCYRWFARDHFAGGSGGREQWLRIVRQAGRPRLLVEPVDDDELLLVEHDQMEWGRARRQRRERSRADLHAHALFI